MKLRRQKRRLRPRCPCVLGSLVSRSAARMAPAAYWASWADALLAGRSPEVANRKLDKLSGHENLVGCLGRHGFVGRPNWVDLRDGARQPVPFSHGPGKRQPGWQHHASSASVDHFRETVMIAQSSCVHTEDLVAEKCSTVLPPNWSSSCNLDFFRTSQKRLPSHTTEARCECGARLDRVGCHRPACARSGRVKSPSDADRQDSGEFVPRSGEQQFAPM